MAYFSRRAKRTEDGGVPTWRIAMKNWSIIVPVLTINLTLSSTHAVAAIDVAVAKKCNALLAKAFPPREPGNPAAGSSKDNGRDAQAYFAKCVAAGGKVEDPAR
jgi:hypothetical protein